MAHFAKINENNIVTEVLVIEQDMIDTGNWGDPSSFVQTSYNTRAGVYYTPNTNNPDPDQSKAFRKNYAGIGYVWLPNGPTGPGFAPPKPYPSWVLNSFSYYWEPPVPMPTPHNPPFYEWDETIVNWIEVPSPNNVE